MRTATKTATNRTLRIITLICYIALAVMFMSTARAQDYTPSPLTILEVSAAADFTDGFIIDCPSEFDGMEGWLICVDTSMTSWDEFQMMDWADYGLGGWSILEGWRLRETVYMKGLWFPSRGESMLIAVAEGFVFYQVWTNR